MGFLSFITKPLEAAVDVVSNVNPLVGAINQGTKALKKGKGLGTAGLNAVIGGFKGGSAVLDAKDALTNMQSPYGSGDTPPQVPDLTSENSATIQKIREAQIRIGKRQGRASTLLSSGNEQAQGSARTLLGF